VRLLDRLASVCSDRRVLNLAGQVCQRVCERGGLFFEYRSGIPRGCPLSPLIGAYVRRCNAWSQAGLDGQAI